MSFADYLTARDRREVPGERWLLGETGLALPRAASLSRWMHGPELPREAQALLGSHEALANPEGLLCVPGGTETGDMAGDGSVWILARAAGGLVSLLVRAAPFVTATQLERDAADALGQAARYCCAHAVLLVQPDNGREPRTAFETFARRHGETAATRDVLYREPDAGAGIALHYGWLSAARRA